MKTVTIAFLSRTLKRKTIKAPVKVSRTGVKYSIPTARPKSIDNRKSLLIDNYRIPIDNRAQ